MIIHNDSRFAIYFGDARDKFIPADFYNLEHSNQLFEFQPFSESKKRMHLNDIVFLKQVHGIDGLFVDSHDQIMRLKPFNHQGDYIITTVPSVGLSIATADCLPIILYDSFSNVIAIVHAGWKGSLKKVAQTALDSMIEQCGAPFNSIKVFFGPSAKVCCYQVGTELLSELEQFSFADTVVLNRNESWYFDLPLFNRLLLQELGLKKEAFHMQYNLCTICDESFCSFRRTRGGPDRQMTMVALK